MSELASSLPNRFPVFPLRGAMLCPGQPAAEHLRAALPADGARRDADRPGHRHDPAEGQEGDSRESPALYRTGCVGRITNFSETGDGRFLITLTGVCRFDVAEELEVPTLTGRSSAISPGGGRTCSRRRRRPS